MRIRRSRVSSSSTPEITDGKENTEDKSGEASECGTKNTGKAEMQKIEVKFKRKDGVGLLGTSG